VFFSSAAYQKSKSVVASRKKVSLQLSSEQSVGDVWIAQMDRKRVPQARSSSCESSVTVRKIKD